MAKMNSQHFKANRNLLVIFRYYIIDLDLRALLFMFNLSQASALTIGPIDTRICMVNLHYMG